MQTEHMQMKALCIKDDGMCVCRKEGRDGMKDGALFNMLNQGRSCCRAMQASAVISLSVCLN